jgi:hypothetical protein
MAKDSKEIEATKRLMAALGRMPPKPHEDMKISKKTPGHRVKKKATKRAKRV